MNHPITVIYVLGKPYSGATFARNIIAKRCGIVELGEVQHWPERSEDNTLCSCSAPLETCEFWAPALSDLEEPDSIKAAFKRTTRRGFAASLILPNFLNRLLFGAIPDKLSTFFEGIRATHGRDMVLDNSDRPAYAAALAQAKGLDLAFFHVVRHPMATAYAAKRDRQSEDETNPKGRSAISAALNWTLSNLSYELVKFRSPLKCTYLRAEHLGDPSLQDILSNQINIVKGGSLHQELTHVISGDPAQPWSETATEPEETWQTGLSWPQKIFCGALTYPLYVFYMNRPDIS